MRRLRPGWTLHELLVSLGVFAAVMGLVAHFAAEQLRFFHGVGEVTALEDQLDHAARIGARVLWGVSPAAGDIIAATDSALELRLPVGTAIVCEAAVGRAIVPVPAEAGNTLASFASKPDVGDRVSLLYADTLGATWLNFSAAEPIGTGEGCGWFGSNAALSIRLAENTEVPRGAVVRVSRPIRLSLYRASDGAWYLGARDWNGVLQRFNSIQPVAGPLRPYHRDPSETGLVFLYQDTAGLAIDTPVVDPASIAQVTVIARSATTRPIRIRGLATRPDGTVLDSISRTVTLRNR